jgi:superfamily II RNA helicase
MGQWGRRFCETNDLLGFARRMIHYLAQHVSKSRFPRRPSKGRGNARESGRGRRSGRGSTGGRPAEGRIPNDEAGRLDDAEFTDVGGGDGSHAEPSLAAGAPTTFREFTLNPFQQKAMVAIRAGKSVVVAAPTGAGKTLVAEIAIADTIARGKRVVYTSPLKALSNQKYRDFKSVAGTQVGILTGDVSINADAPLLIMTTEILRNEIFDAPHKLVDVETVIFDEVHYLDDADRGTVWEEAILFAPRHMRFVALSATIPNLRQFVNWLRREHARPVEQIESRWRPVPLHHFGYHPIAGEFDISQIEKVRQRVGRVGQRRQDPDMARNLLTSLQQRKELPVLWFCFSRKECERRARHNVWRTLLNSRERAEVETLFDETCAVFQQPVEGDLLEMRVLASKGIGYHHAGMLPVHKEITERLFTSGLLKLLFTTETFAMGINMPAKTVVFDALRKFNGIEFDWLRTRDYMQMAGRAGRQGMDKEGKVVSVLDTEDLHDAPVERIVHGELEPVRSRFNLNYGTLLRLTKHLGGRIEEAWERSFNAYQHEGVTEDRRERNRARHLEMLRKKLQFLRKTGFLDDRGLTDRGRIASRLAAFEVQLTDCFFRGVFEDLNSRELAAAFIGIVYEGRKGETMDYPVPASFAPIKRRIVESVRDMKREEFLLRMTEGIQRPDFSLTTAAFAWCHGDTIDALERQTMTAAGDIVRTFRTAIQCLRNMRAAVSPSYSLYHRLTEAISLLNRDEVDARRQLELGGVEIEDEEPET